MPDAGTGLLIVTVAEPTNAVVTGHPSSWSTAGIECQVSMPSTSTPPSPGCATRAIRCATSVVRPSAYMRRHLDVHG